MTADDMRHAGAMASRLQYDDEGLALIVEANKLALAYLVGRGSGWELATFPLKKDQEMFEQLLRSRKGGA